MNGRIRSVRYSFRFLKRLSKLPERMVDEAQRKEVIFKQNPFAPILRTHKLHGKDKDLWAFRVNYAYRIKFTFLSDEEVLFLDIGTHEIYK